MTQNQVNYLNWKETNRANLAKEVETQRHNLEQERIQREQLVEAQRARIASNVLDLADLYVSHYHQSAQERENSRWHDQSYVTNLLDVAETQQYHQKMLAQNQLDLNERIQHNRNTEWISAYSLGETKRSNLAKELETNRTNLVNEQIKQFQADTDRAYSLNNISLGAWKAEVDAQYKEYSLGLEKYGKDIDAYRVNTNYELGLANIVKDYDQMLLHESNDALKSATRMLLGQQLTSSFSGGVTEFAPITLQPPMLTASAGNG